MKPAPCPYCSEAADDTAVQQVYAGALAGWAVSHWRCGASGPIMLTSGLAVGAWNALALAARALRVKAQKPIARANASSRIR